MPGRDSTGQASGDRCWLSWQVHAVQGYDRIHGGFLLGEQRGGSVHPGRVRVVVGVADTNLILRLWDEAPNGQRQLVTTGFLKASHRELDERTTEGNPYHPHTRSVPVDPGVIEEYVVRLYPFATSFQPGHRLVVELSNDEPLADAHNALLPPDAFHLPVGRPVTHKIYRDASHPSRLVLPFVVNGAE